MRKYKLYETCFLRFFSLLILKSVFAMPLHIYTIHVVNLSKSLVALFGIKRRQFFLLFLITEDLSRRD